MAETCRCGFNGEGEHPCHGKAYSCRKPAKQRFYGAHLTALAGVQMKLGVNSTWACDECWSAFTGQPG
jgi:hypothetical protein